MDSALVVRNVAVIHQVLVDGFQGCDDLCLDISKEDFADLCGLQLIESARCYAKTTGKRLSLLRPAEQMRSLLENIGFFADAPSDLHRFWLHEGPAQ
ncbi:STAS domain-containing protein [Brevundimonas sp. M-11_2]